MGVYSGIILVFGSGVSQDELVDTCGGEGHPVKQWERFVDANSQYKYQQ